LLYEIKVQFWEGTFSRTQGVKEGRGDTADTRGKICKEGESQLFCRVEEVEGFSDSPKITKVPQNGREGKKGKE